MEYSEYNVSQAADSMGFSRDSTYTMPNVGAGSTEPKKEEQRVDGEGELEPGPSGNKYNSERLLKRPRSRSIERRLRVIEIQLMCLTKQVEKVLCEVRSFQRRHSRRRSYKVSCPKSGKWSKTERLKGAAAGEQATDRQGTSGAAAQIEEVDTLHGRSERCCATETNLQRSHFVERECPCLMSVRHANTTQEPPGPEDGTTGEHN